MAVLGYTLAELGIIAACFTCNVALVNSVKFIQYTLHYPYPLLISAMHMVFSWLACGVYVKFNVPALREYTFSRYMKESVEKEAKRELEEFDIEDNNAEVASVSSDEDGEEETGKE
ncbi:hypothetical protein FOZ63_030135 [Perkinsus olseni]|uniref:Uncharacterized protein n=1 Tax=Perkinsus olseni TaxID=32597 RepID=A0A7J6RGI7_PEROL|nr:hypothetical protein FOZ63_030135 [Perkinsus olseni]KAF4719753.1 hypothetical protein FOZ62_023324 [Perkinsus olseni]